MDEIKEKKQNIRYEIREKLSSLPEEELAEKTSRLEMRLFDFANFMESKIPLLYLGNGSEVPTMRIIRKSLAMGKIVVLPVFGSDKQKFRFFKIDDPEADLVPNADGVLSPDTEKCKPVPVDRVDIAIIPGIALDEKGGRLGNGNGRYDRLIPKLSATTRKVALGLEAQIVGQIPMQSHDKHVDIIVTEERVIYKI